MTTTTTPENPATAEAPPPLWKPDRVAELLGCSLRTLRRLVAAEGLPCVRLRGRAIRFEPGKVRAWIAARETVIAPRAGEVEEAPAARKPRAAAGAARRFGRDGRKA